MYHTFVSVDEILKCVNSNESYYAIFSVVLFFCNELLGLWMKSSSVTIQMEATEQYFPMVLFIYVVQGGSKF